MTTLIDCSPLLQYFRTQSPTRFHRFLQKRVSHLRLTCNRKRNTSLIHCSGRFLVITNELKKKEISTFCFDCTVSMSVIDFGSGFNYECYNYRINNAMRVGNWCNNYCVTQYKVQSPRAHWNASAKFIRSFNEKYPWSRSANYNNSNIIRCTAIVAITIIIITYPQGNVVVVVFILLINKLFVIIRYYVFR